MSDCLNCDFRVIYLISVIKKIMPIMIIIRKSQFRKDAEKHPDPSTTVLSRFNLRVRLGADWQIHAAGFVNPAGATRHINPDRTLITPIKC